MAPGNAQVKVQPAVLCDDEHGLSSKCSVFLSAMPPSSQGAGYHPPGPSVPSSPLSWPPVPPRAVLRAGGRG